MKGLSFGAIASVAYKEFLHIYRDRRVLVLLLILPPLFTLLFGHAFETTDLTDVPALLVDRDGTPTAQRFIDIVSKNKTFQWRKLPPEVTNESDLLGYGVQAALVVPQGWSETLRERRSQSRCRFISMAATRTRRANCKAASSKASPIFR